MTTEKKRKDLVLGAVVGSVLGAVTALLFAPKAGRELRGDIADGYRQVSEKTQQVASDVSDRTQAAVETLGKHTSNWADKAKETAIQVGQGVKSWRAGKQAKQDETALAEASVAATAVEREEN